MAEMNYLDFDLLIERIDQGKYRARVLSSPGGQAVREVSFPFSELELENFMLKVGRTRRGVRRLESPEMEAAKVFGDRLFKSVFDDELAGCLRSSIDEARKQRNGLRIRLRLNDAPELLNFPWEFLYNASLNRFLSLSVSTPLVRYMDLPERINPLQVNLPLRVLVVISSPSDYPILDVEREWNNLQNALKDLTERGVIVLERLETATPTQLQYATRRNEYHIFHFIGHGGFNVSAQDGVLLFEDENKLGRQLSGQYLGTILHDEQTLRLAVLNACEGGRTGTNDPFAGVAQSLVQQGVPAVIGMQFEVTDQAAITFARDFYTAIADGYPVDAALAEARKAIYSLGNDIEWGTPVLYMRAPDGKVFDVAQESKAALAAAQKTMPDKPTGADIPEKERRSLEKQDAVELEQLYVDGLSAYWLKDWARAWELFRQVVEIDPQYQDAAVKLEAVKKQLTLATQYEEALSHVQAQRWEAAVNALEKIAAEEPGYKDSAKQLENARRQARLEQLYTQANQLHKAKQWQAVINVFSQIHSIQADFPDPDGLLENARSAAAEDAKQKELKALYSDALKAMESKDWKTAQKLLSRIQVSDANYAESRSLLERVQAELKAVESAAVPESAPITEEIQRAPRLTEKVVQAAPEKAAAAPAGLAKMPRWALYGGGGAIVFILLVVIAKISGIIGSPTATQAFLPTERFAEVTEQAIETEVMIVETAILEPTATATMPVVGLQPAIPWLPREVIAVHETYTETMHYTSLLMYLDFWTAPLNDVRIRDALASAVDRESLPLPTEQYSSIEPATNILHPDVINQDLYNQVGIQYDPELAQMLMAEAGYPDAEGFPIITFNAVNDSAILAIVNYLAMSWRENLGIRTELLLYADQAALLAAIQPSISHSPNIYLITWSESYRDPSRMMNRWRSNSASNPTFFSNPEYDDLIDTAFQLPDEPEVRQEIYNDADRLLTEEEVVVIPIFHAAGVGIDVLQEIPPGKFVRINSITPENNLYVVAYETFEYLERLPGEHIHFFFNTIPPEQAGLPAANRWYLYGGPRPFKGYTTADRPSGATEMCALVANPDHTVIQNTGTCYPLP